MLAVLAEFERDQISERTAAAMQFKKAKGERVGSIPYGFRLGDDGVKLISDETEQAALSLIRALNGKGLSLRNIARRLESAGYIPRGKSWHPQTVANILNAEAA